VLLVSTASAATVRKERGVVSINRGHGYEPVSDAREGKPGDLVVASPAGKGTIIYSDGCEINVEPNDVTYIQQGSPCKVLTPRSNVRSYVIGAALVGGVVAGIILLSHDDSHPASP
jgi:hypothetical protein